MKAAELFGNDMILQRNTAVPVWGDADPGEKITVRIQGQEVSAITGSDGKWFLTLNNLKTSFDETMEIEGEKETLRFIHAAVGEVWIASGQSNMEFQMRYDKDFAVEVKRCTNPNIRTFDYPVVVTEEARNRFDFSKNFGFWRRSDPENLQWFSAVGYYFAKYLQNVLEVPLGIVGLNCGGTRSACWMDEKTLMKCGPVWMEDYENGLKKIPDLKKAEEEFMNSSMADHTDPFTNSFNDRLMYGVTLEELKQTFENLEGAGVLTIGPWHEWRPAGLYHTMVKRVAPYAAKGVLWYQGESDEDHPEIHQQMMKGLISLWREIWGKELPFIMVQLAPFGELIGNGGKAYPVLRAQQELVTKTVPDVYLVPTGDVGNIYDIHPKEKQPIGQRMALQARRHVYGEDILCDAPVPGQVSRDGCKIMIAFDHADEGLILKGEKVNALQVFSDGNEISPEEIQTVVQDNTLIILLPDSVSQKQVTIAFAMTPWFEVNLYNRSDVPVFPFSIDI